MSIAGGITGALIAPFGIHSFNRVYHAPRQWLSATCLVAILVVDVLLVSFATAAAGQYRAGTFN